MENILDSMGSDYFAFKSRNSLRLWGLATLLLLFLYLNFGTTKELRCMKPKYTNCTMIYKTMALWCDQTNLTSIPTPENLVGDFDAPPAKSSRIIFRQSCIESIDKDSLKHYSWVVVLDLSGNFIKILQVNAFPNLRKLKRLYLNNNRLNRIEENPFDKLTNLLDLRLDYNDIASISDSTFSGLPHLVNLTLSNNKLKTLPQEAFRMLPHLKMLDLSGNQLKKFLPEHLILLSNLESLNLNGNQIEKFDSHIYLAANNITKLYLNNNSIDCFAANAFEKTDLTVIEIANNPLKRPHNKWFSTFLRENNAERVEASIIISRSGSWICDCKVYSYYIFLLSLTDKWREKLDIECSKPHKLRGARLSQLDWNLLSLHGNCSVPDDYDPCPNRNHKPHIPAITTTTTPTTTTTTTEEPPPELPTERPSFSDVPQTNQDKNELILTARHSGDSENSFMVLAAVIGIMFCVTIVGTFFCVYYHRRFSTEKNRLDSLTKAERSSKIDPLVDCFDSSPTHRPLTLGPRTSSCKNQDDSNSGNYQEPLPTPFGETTPGSPSDNSHDSFHHYDRLNFTSFEPSAQQKLLFQHPQEIMSPPLSSKTSFYTGIQPTNIHLTIPVPIIQQVVNPTQTQHHFPAATPQESQKVMNQIT